MRRTASRRAVLVAGFTLCGVLGGVTLGTGAQADKTVAAAAMPAPEIVRAASRPVAPPPPPAPAPVDITLAVAVAEVVSPGLPTGPLVDPTLGDVTRVVHDFLDITSTKPLTGIPGPGLAAVLTDDAAARAATVDRPVLFDEGVPTAPVLVADEAVVELRALAGRDNSLELVVARFTWDVTGAAHVRRSGELTLVPTPAGWRISAYDIAVGRS